MYQNKNFWEKLGCIISPNATIDWMSTSCGPACAEILDEEKGEIRIYMAGRDRLNRSQIGFFEFNVKNPWKPHVISEDAVMPLGDLGAFDENGISYPYLVKSGKDQFLYYNGWMPSVLTPFQVHLGCARRLENGEFERVSKAPILPRTNDDHLSIGSVAVIVEEGEWKMWYTSFIKWGSRATEHKHYYHIKYATSNDGITWNRNNEVCITFQSKDEFAISRPTVLKHNGSYHMWFSYRGQEYKIGYAHSEDGISWNRRDDLVGFGCSAEGWDSKAVCYPYVFKFQNYLYLLYCGNNYGKEGLGLARLPL